MSEPEYQICVIDGLPALEDALTKPLLSQWEGLLESDPTATLFQSPVWCLPWYRAYTQFDPRVMLISTGTKLTGVVPLASEKQTGRLTFAGDNIADYKDVVTLSECRERLLVELLRYLRAEGHGYTFYFGSTQPQSESPAIIERVSGKCGVRMVLRINSGWRWWPAEQTEDPLKKKSVRYPINYFKRQGELCAQHLQTIEEWDAFKEPFYRQHTLRQIYGGRPVAFDNPERRAFFDGLVRTPYAHVTALRLNIADVNRVGLREELIAGHVGFVYKNVLYWGAPAFDIRYNQYSPNLVLLIFTMKNAEAWGLTGIDLTVGKGELKERFSTSRVDVPYVELYPRFSTYGARILRIKASEMKARVLRWGESDAGKRVRGWLAPLTSRFRRDSSAPPQLITMTATPDSLQSVAPRVDSGEQLAIHQNEIYDLLQRDIAQDEGGDHITKAARTYTDALKQGKTFYTVLVNDRLAAWGYASRAEAGGSSRVVLSDFYTLPEFRGRRLASALAVHIARLHFEQGAAEAAAEIPADAAAARKAAGRAGFTAAGFTTAGLTKVSSGSHLIF